MVDDQGLVAHDHNHQVENKYAFHVVTDVQAMDQTVVRY